ncbi:unnamed protein product [Adineta steineri]|uniref:Cadherin domain-containing protein n=1 Tax=Adineta steineri TaxID=433720 RepID=A0A816BY75_9BILA|nr:unnamed protein product [Adineta steineri]CAF1615930.1 unnamed protein product [Adineta steineri]
MKMPLNLFIFLTFLIPYSSSIVSQILTSVSIFEESPISTIVVDLRPTFQTLNVHPDQAVLLHSQPSQPFEYINGRIRLKSRLDREDYVRKRLCLGGNVLECNFTLTLTVNLNQAPFNYILSQPISCHDINDIIPKFSQLESTISMAENVPIGHRIPLETAIDLDSPPYGIDHYRLVTFENHEQHQFSIVYDNQSRELELIVNEKLDREKIEKYIFKLMAIDRGHPPNIGTQMLTIEISDINDCQPKFESSVYNITVAENTLPEYLLKVRAIDTDIGSNAELTYTLENDHNGLFLLDKTTGILTLTHSLDYEFHTSYQLKVEVHDNGVNSLSDTCIINIYVLDQNDHAPSIQMKFNPKFEHNQDGNMAYVPENFDIHLPIAFVNVHDQDSGDYGKSQLTIEPSRLFYLEIIRPNYYSIKSLQGFDRETTSTYQIELRARDFGQPSLRRSMTFDLNITDINDQKPLFKTNYTFDINENNQIPSVIGQVNAYDADQGLNGQINYSIEPPTPYFIISSIDGIITTNTSFNYESKRQYNFQVRARDYGQPPLESYAFVEVNILNLNEYSPEFEKKIYYFIINENSTHKNLTFIGQVKANDPDYGDHVTYSLHDGEPLFTIDQNGNIWTEAIFDREEHDEYKLTVTATDNSTAGLIGTTTVIIKIQDINDNYPVFIWPDPDEILHSLSGVQSQRTDPANPLSQFITDIVVRDDDIGNNSFVQLSVTNNELFYIGSNNSLWLYNSSILPGTYDIEIVAKNLDLITKKIFHVIIYNRSSSGTNLLYYMRRRFSDFSLLIIIFLSFIATGSTIFLLIYYLWMRLHYTGDVKKHLYGSRLIVNDEDKSKQNSPQTKMNILSTNHNHDYAVIVKQRKNSQIPSGNSSSTTDGEFSSSLLSCPLNGTLSSSIDLHSSHQNPPSSTVSALTTLTRKATRRQQTKNVSFEPTTINPTHNLFDDIFQYNSSCYHETTPSSTFSTLPRQTKRDISTLGQQPQSILSDSQRNRQNGFPTLQTILNPLTKDNQTKYPQPPPLLNGIRLLDQMLTDSAESSDERTQTLSPSGASNSGWYNVTSNYQTKASIV